MLNIPNSTYYSHTGVMNIAIHIRTGDLSFRNDNLININNSNIKEYFHCAKQIEDSYLQNIVESSNGAANGIKLPKVIWHLFTDSRKLRADALQLYGPDKISTAVNITVKHTANESGQNKPKKCSNPDKNCVSTHAFNTAAGML